MNAQTFTQDDVKALAELIAPMLAHQDVRAAVAAGNVTHAADMAVALTADQDRAAFERCLRHLDEIVDALGGTYDEFRAEVAA